MLYLLAMTAEMRACSRTGCRWPAAASLSFRYASGQVWLLDLSDPDPALYDLCPHHVDTLVVPRGWHRVDQRTAAPVVREPSGEELVTRGREPVAHYPAREPVRRPAPATRTNRYERLHRELPRLAKEFGDEPGGEPGVIVPIDAARRPPGSPVNS